MGEEREINLYYFISSLYYFIKLYVKIKIEM